MKDLLSAAREARKHSHSPYSRYAVGAALRTEDGSIVSGCNVENASLGLTICAERTAIVKAVSEGHHRIREIAVITSSNPPAAPCGLCRQALAEFADDDLLIYCEGGEGKQVTLRLGDLLPMAFRSGAMTGPQK